MAHLAEVARSFMGLGEYRVKQQFSTAEDKAKGTKLMETIGNIKMDEVKKEMQKLAKERLQMGGPPRIQGRGHPNVHQESDSDGDETEEEEEEEVQLLEQEEEVQQLTMQKEKEQHVQNEKEQHIQEEQHQEEQEEL